MNSRLVSAFDAVSRSSDRALTDQRGDSSFVEVGIRARTLADALLSLGLGGARVALLGQPDRDWVDGFWAIVLAGGCVVPLSPLHPAPERHALLAQSRARALLVSETMSAEFTEHTGAMLFGGGRVLSAAAPTGHAPGCSRSGKAAAGDPEHAAALLLYTSGTTGRPKGVSLSHFNVFEGIRALTEAWQITSHDRLLHTLPLHHLHGICVALLTAQCAGAATTFLARYSAAAVLEAVPGSTLLMGVPTQHQRLLEHLEMLPERERQAHAAELSRLRLITSGSAKLPERVGRRLEQLSGQYPLERYGMTEVGIVISNPLFGARLAGSPGRPLPGYGIRIVDELGRDAGPGEPGEIWIQGASVFAEYDADPESTSAAFESGYFKSGDTAAWTPDGNVRILGRTSVDIIKSGGYKLSAIEIEEQVRAHPWVEDVAVVGLPDDLWGERVVAVVIPNAQGRIQVEQDGQRALEELKAWLRQRMAGYQVPKTLSWWDQLPRNALGKVQKVELIAELGRRT